MQIVKKIANKLYKSAAIKTVVFLSILCIILCGIFKVLRFKFVDGIRPLDRLYQLEDNTVDVLFIGSSRVFININPAILYLEQGIASYILSGSAQPFWNTYYYLQEALKTQKPDLVVLEGYSLEIDTDYTDKSRIIKNNFGLPLSPNMIKSLIASTPAGNFMPYLFRFDFYHSRYSELSRSDFFTNYGDVMYNDWHGYHSSFRCNQMAPSSIELTNETLPLTDKVEDYYRKIIELCINNNIPIEIIVAPTILSYADQKRLYNQGSAIAGEYGVDFTDFHDYEDAFHFDYSKDFVDASHFNYFGGTKFTSYLGGFLKDRYNLPDRRGDERYASWKREADWFLQTMENNNIQKLNSVSEIVQATRSNQSYVCFLSLHDANNERINTLGSFISDALTNVPESNKNFTVLIESGNLSIIDFDTAESSHYIMGSHSFYLPVSGGIFVDKEIVTATESNVNLVVYDKITDTIVLRVIYNW